MYNYFRELRSDYEGPTEGLLHFLNKNAQKDDSIFTANAGYVLHFWTGLKITNEIPFQSPPTWLIRLGTVSWGRQVCENNGLDADQYIKDYLKSYNYQVILLDYPNILYENEPVLFRHYWVTPTQQSPIALYWYPPRP
jgi:hypothetical protein